MSCAPELLRASIALLSPSEKLRGALFKQHPQPASPFSYPEASAPSVQAPTPVNNKAWPPPPPAGTKKIRSIHNYSAREADELGFAKFEELFVFPTPVEVSLVCARVFFCQNGRVFSYVATPREEECFTNCSP